VQQAGETSDRSLGSALISLADFERNMALIEQARDHNEQALSIYRELDDVKGIADAARQLGVVYQHLDDFARSAEYLEEALAYYRTSGDDEILSFTLLVQGGGKQLQGDLAGAQALYEEGLELARQQQDPNYLATALLNLGEVLQLRQQTARAAELIRESLQLYAELEVRNAISYCLEMLAAIDAVEGRPEEAAQLFGAADKIREDIGVPVESFNLERYDQDLDAVKNALGQTTFEQHWASGRGLKIAEAVSLAQLDFA
jgi:tetratricopeptide (TPR) repeat protein